MSSFFIGKKLVEEVDTGQAISKSPTFKQISPPIIISVENLYQVNSLFVNSLFIPIVPFHRNNKYGNNLVVNLIKDTIFLVN